MKKILSASTAVFVIAAITIACVSCSRGTATKSPQVRIGINVPLTGPIAAWSGQFPNGFMLGIEDACKANGLDPAIFQVDVQDNEGKPSQAVSIFNMQKLKGLDGYVSVATGPANANAQELDAMKIPHFIAAFDPLITRGSPSRFRVMANSKIEAPLFIDYARRKQAKSIHVIQINMAYAEEQWSTVIIPELESLGASVTRDRFELSDRDFKTIAEKAKSRNADLIYICGYSFHVQPLLGALRTNGLVQRGRVVSVMDFVDLVYTGTSAAELQDVIFICPLFDVPGRVAAAADWRARYEERFKMKPTYVPAYAYDNATLIVKAYAEFKKVDAASLLGAQPFRGINGMIALDAERDIRATVTLAEIDQAGNIVPVE